ncbi:DUF4198 domain-containing protein [Palleronia sp. KMU-117]|uniref:DUF4198 domain-containing protein n=1 Tax=Palleronia sp. KMU-117 TaxID=3434108 RepID=UPI003D7449BD
MSARPAILAPILACLAATPAMSHEFWIDPVEFQLPADAPIVADLRVGQAFVGASQPFLPFGTRVFEVVLDGDVVPVEPRMGDRPALNVALPGEGLAIAVHVTGDSNVTYTDFSKFEAFVTHKDAVWTVAAHRARGLPDAPFTEVYSRYAKSLVAIGDGLGEDRALGLETEIVALENPYTGDMSDGIEVAVFYRQNPRSEAVIEVFERAPDDSVTVSTVRSDDRGRATVPVKPGHEYMLDTVVLREPAPELAAEKGAVWESLWANLTFAVPE